MQELENDGPVRVDMIATLHFLGPGLIHDIAPPVTSS